MKQVARESVITSVLQLVQDRWGLSGRVTRLPGENLNLRLELDEGDSVVIKATGSQIDIEFEETLIDALRGLCVATPVTRTTLDGQPHADLEDGTLRIRVQRFLPGVAWRETETTPALLEHIGAVTARLHLQLADVACDGVRRTHRWDLAQGHHHRSAAVDVPDSRRRVALEQCFHVAAATVDHQLPQCPAGLLHGDINDENVLVADDRVVGLLDFGDWATGSLIQDLAIAAAYALQQPGVALDGLGPLVSGYGSVRGLEGIEQEVFFPLLLRRLAMSAAIGLKRRLAQPDHDTWFSHEQATWDTLLQWSDTPPRDAMQVIFGASEHNDTTRLIEERAALIGPSLSLSYDAPLHIVRGRGQYLFDAAGRPYLDLVNNVCHVGHCHPSVVDAIASQAAMLNTNTRYLHENITAYASRLTATLPEGLDVCFFLNSGSEANELALRLARAATGSNDVLVIDGAYHGSTGNCIAMSPYKFNGPGGSGCPDWVHVVPRPDVYRGEIRDDPDAGPAYALEVGRVIGEACHAGRSIAGFFAESLLSCGGQIPLPDGYLTHAFEHVRRAGGVCIADEVQVGFGRVGDHFWGFECDGVVPDIVVMGKPIGNGHPLAAVVTTAAIAESFNNGMEFFATFGGNPVSCACGLAVLDVIEAQGLQQRARQLGSRFMDGLRTLQDTHDLIGDVRGRGLFIGVELVRDRASRTPAPQIAAAIVNTLQQRGLLLSTDGPDNNVIKIKPPMVLTADDVDMSLRQLDLALHEVRELRAMAGS